jgi:hypothetical protein
VDDHVSSEESIKDFSALVRCQRFLGISFLFKNAGGVDSQEDYADEITDGNLQAIQIKARELGLIPT